MNITSRTLAEPLVSVIIPTLQEEGYIRKTITDVLRNTATFPKFEIVVADSGSTDNTQKEALKAQVDAERLGVRLSWIQATEKGASRARNTGAGIAQGKHFLFLDADTSIDDDFLRVNRDKMIARELAIGGVYMRPDSGKLVDQFLVGCLNKPLLLAQYTSRAAAFGAALFVERNAFEQLGGFDVEIPYGEDVQFVREAVRQGHLFRMIGVATTSSRRAEMYGRWDLTKRALAMNFKTLVHGTPKGAGIDYPFGVFGKK